MINDPVDDLGNTFLIYSIISKDNGLTAFLCSKGANLTIKNKAGVCPNDLLQDNFIDFNKWASMVDTSESLFNLCIKGQVDAVKEKLNNTSPDIGQEPWFPIVGAIYNGNEPIVRTLIDNGIDVNQKVNGKSLIKIAALLQRKNIVALLLQRGAIVDDNPEKWLRQEVLDLKKKSTKSNLWLGFKKDEIMLDALENDSVNAILTMLTSSRETITKQVSDTRPKSLNSILKEYFDLEILIDSTIGCCTKLDKFWILMLQSTVALAKAVMEKRKHSFAPLALAIINGHAELSQEINYHLKKFEEKPMMAMCKSIMVQKITRMLAEADTQKLLNVTRLATGVWPPDDAENNMIRSFIGLLKSDKTLILLSKVGFELEILHEEIQFKYEEGNTSRELEDLSYDDYRRMNEMSMINNMAKSLKISHDAVFSDDQDSDEDDSLLELLDCHLNHYVTTVKVLMKAATQRDQETVNENICAIKSIIMNVLGDVKRSYYYINLSHEITVTKEEILNFLKESKVDVSLSLKTILRNQMEMINDSVHRLAKFSSLQSWSYLKLMEATYTCCTNFKLTLILLKELSQVMSHQLKAVRKKQAEWKNICVKSEKAQKLLNALIDPKTMEAGSINIDSSPDAYLLKGAEDEIQYDVTEDGKRDLRGASLSRLVDKLVVSGVQESEYVSAFVTIFPNIIAPRHFFEMLKKRYNLEAPLGINQSQFEIFISKVVIPIRLNVCRIINTWFELHPRDFSDQQLLALMKQFISHCVNRDIPSMAKSLNSCLDKIQRFAENGSVNGVVDLSEFDIDRNTAEKIKKALGQRGPLPNQINLDVEIYDIDPMVAGKQLTLLEFHLFQKITPDVLLDQFQNRNQFNEFIDHTNDLSTWITCCILSSTDIKVRALRIKYFIQLASACLELKNLSGVTCVVGGLVMVPVSRLKKTWAVVKKNEKIYEDFLHCCEIVSPKHQYSRYRKTLKTFDYGIPFLGVYYTDLEFIRVGNPSFLPNSFINWKKQFQVYSLIKEIKRFQSSNFPWPKSYCYTYFKHIKETPDYKNWDGDIMYGKSLDLEP